MHGSFLCLQQERAVICDIIKKYNKTDEMRKPMIYKQRDKGGLALLPFIIFIVIYLGAGIYFQHMGVEMAFYQFPSVTAMFLAVIAAFCMGG